MNTKQESLLIQSSRQHCRVRFTCYLAGELNQKIDTSSPLQSPGNFQLSTPISTLANFSTCLYYLDYISEEASFLVFLSICS